MVEDQLRLDATDLTANMKLTACHTNLRSMLRTPILPTAILVLLSLSPVSAEAQMVSAVGVQAAGGRAFPIDSVSAERQPRTLAAMAQGLLANVAINRIDAHIIGHDWARVTPSSWSGNLNFGWTWDEDEFEGNMFAHPLHGSLYFNAGRANALDFWESIPLTFLGSWQWEYFGETKRPSLNDFIMTGFGGIVMGEVLHRLGASIRDNTLTGRSRLLREVAAFPLDAMGSINRMINGDWSRVGANPPEHAPESFVMRIATGVRLADDGRDDASAALSSSATAVFDLSYGDSFIKPYSDPFDVFSVRAQLSPGGGDLNHVRASGRLFGLELNPAGIRSRHVVAVNQRLDYLSNPAHRFGAQSVEGGIYSRWRLSNSTAVRTQAFAGTVVLGAIDAPFSGVGERSYDFGPGVGFRLQAAYERSGVIYASIEARTDYLHTVSGAAADHNVSMGGVEVTLPLGGGFGVGFQSGYYNRLSRYSDHEDESRESPEIRLALVWTAKRQSHNVR